MHRRPANTSASSAPRQALGTPTTVVVTGATGFVGGQLLKRLIARGASVICPVRAGSTAEAATRGQARLVELVGAQNAEHARHNIEWIRADLEDAHLGWNTATWRDVAARTSEIYHCAASVSFDLPLAEAQRINVDGTEHIYELAEHAQAMHGQFRRFHHVSTAYVAGTKSGRVTADHLPSDRASNFRNTYERTKARAERLLQTRVATAGASVAPVSIYRPSIVGGDSVTGETDNWNVLYVPMKMAARGMLPTFSKGSESFLDTVGVDYVVDGMLALGEWSTDSLHTFHLVAGPGAFDVEDLIETTITHAGALQHFTPSQTRVLGRAQWMALTAGVHAAARVPERFSKVRRQGKIARRALDGCSVYVPYTRVDTVFDNEAEVELLSPHGVAMPMPRTYLRTIVDYALAADFGKRPVLAPAPSSDSDDLVIEPVAA